MTLDLLKLDTVIVINDIVPFQYLTHSLPDY